MANLKGATFEKQKRDMNFKLFALGTKKESGYTLTHSEALLIKRDMYFNDFTNYLESTGQTGKFNLLLSEENLNGFLEQRLENLSLNSARNYLSGFNSLLSAFKEVNIQVGVRADYFQDKFTEIKQTTPPDIKEPRGLQSDNILNDLKNIRYESFVLGKLMLNYGFRVSEGLRIVNEPEKYIKALSDGSYSISGVVGKGGKIYHDKIMNHKDRELIKNMKNIPSKQTFNRELKQIDTNLRAHDFRYQYARNQFEKKVSEVGYDKALLAVSKALNHNRSEITKYYIL